MSKDDWKKFTWQRDFDVNPMLDTMNKIKDANNVYLKQWEWENLYQFPIEGFIEPND
jgi:hypothetical protein